jgi:O-antigen ligase/Flp pilus assembly protein TadD
LVFQKKLFFSYDSEKGLFFRLVLEILFGLWLILIVKTPSFRPRPTPINIALGFFSIVLIIVDILGVDTYLSVFSNFERMAGLILYLCIFAYCLVISSIITSPKRWLIFGISLSVIAFIVATKGIIQSYDQEEMLINSGRAISTIGNANQLASYLILGFFVVGLLINEWILPLRKSKPLLSALLVIIAGIFLIIYLICLLKTSTRGALIGLILGSGLMLILLFFKTSQKSTKLISGIILISVFLSVSGLFYFRKATFIQQNSALNRITRITDNDGTNTLKSRLENYKVAIEGIKAKPFFGWGQETYHYTYAQFFNPKLYADATWYDRVHNVILEWLIIGGILGLIAYSCLWGTVVYQLWRKNSSLNIIQKIILSGFLFAYFVGNLSLFDNLLSLMAFMIVIAFIENHTLTEQKPSFELNHKIFLISSTAIIISTFFLIKITCQQAYQANKAIVKAYSAGSLEEVIETYAQAYPKAIIGRQEIAEQLANMAKDIANNPIPEATKQRYFEVAKSIMLSEIGQHPKYARLQIIYGNLLEAQGDNLGAIKTFEKVQNLAPKRQSNLMQLAMLYAKNREFDKANSLLEKTYLLEKQNEEPIVYQAIVWAMKGEHGNSKKEINQLTDKELNKSIDLVRYAFVVSNNLDGFLEICNKRFLGNINTLPNTYKVWAMTAFNLKNTQQTATAVYAFRRHFAEEENFKDSREANLISQDILKGIDPSFAFEKVGE